MGSPIKAADLKPGDLVDLEGDVFADPDGYAEPGEGRVEFQYELAMVASVTPETPGCVAVGFEGIDLFGFPPDHVFADVTRPSEGDY